MFQYFLPDQTEVTRQSIIDAGLGGVFRDLIANPVALARGISTRMVHGHGPGGNRGILFAPVGQVPQLGFDNESQQWTNCGEYWLGFMREPAFGPSIFARSQAGGFTPGVNLVLGDGHIWEVPTIRASGRWPALPRRMGFDAAGEFELTILPEYDFAWAASGEIFDLAFGKKQGNFEIAFSLCVQVLSLNYRIGERETAELGLITTQNFQDIFRAAIDWEKIQELLGESEVQKKTESAPEPASTSPGTLAG